VSSTSTILTATYQNGATNGAENRSIVKLNNALRVFPAQFQSVTAMTNVNTAANASIIIQRQQASMQGELAMAINASATSSRRLRTSACPMKSGRGKDKKERTTANLTIPDIKRNLQTTCGRRISLTTGLMIPSTMAQVAADMICIGKIGIAL
jgi:hypothetical protein